VSLTAMRTWTLRQRVVALCALTGAVLTVIGTLAALTAASNNRHLDTVLDKAGPMRAAGESLNTALVDQETGVRGFALSGKEADLVPYERGVAEEAKLIAQIQRLLGPRDTAVRASLDEVRTGAASWRRTVAEPVIAAVRGQGVTAGQDLLTPDARVRFDDLRASLERLQVGILALRNQAAAAARETGGQLLLLEVGAATVVLFAAVALLLLLDRMVSRPVVDLAEQVRGVAGGDYERKIVSNGSPELARLAEDIDAMRRQISAELAQVREARGQVEWVNDQLQQQAAELTRSNRDLEQFAYVASHDLQEPLRKVASFTQLLERRYKGQLDERADQYIAFAVDGAKRMQVLINDLLAFSRVGRLTREHVEADAGDLVRQALTNLSLAVEETGAEVTVAEPMPRVSVDQSLMVGVFQNLIGNAIKFRGEAPPEIRVEVQDAGDEWEFRIADNGIGIEADYADRIFVIFQRLHPKDAYPGTGIGLAMCRKIIEYHGGRIWLDTAVTSGTTFRFTLPKLPEPSQTPPPVTEPVDE
jgi:signal transduction histidine kinase